MSFQPNDIEMGRQEPSEDIDPDEIEIEVEIDENFQRQKKQLDDLRDPKSIKKLTHFQISYLNSILSLSPHAFFGDQRVSEKIETPQNEVI